MGNLLCIHVHAANIHDTKGGVYTFEKALYRYPTIQAGCADGGYRGTFRNTFDEFHNIRIDISMQIKEQKGFQVVACQAKRKKVTRKTQKTALIHPIYGNQSGFSYVI